jgi:hypothetical protein
VAVLLLVLVVPQLDLATFLAALAGINYVAFLAFAALFSVSLLLADAAATRVVYKMTVCPIGYWDLVTLRGASYLPSMLNYHVGQGWLTYFLSKVYNAQLWRVAGATLLGYATTFGALLLIGLSSLPFSYERLPWLLPTSVAIGVAGLGYLAVIHARPRFLLNRVATAPLVEVGVRGHLLVLLVRLPHMAVLFMGNYVPFLLFGVDVPFGDALALVPPLLLVVGLPITPQGVGTRDALAVQLLAGYAPGSHSEQVATIIACTLTWAVSITLCQLMFSPLLMRRAYRLLRASDANKAPAEREGASSDNG